MIENICESIELNLLYRTRVACPFLYHSTLSGIKCFMGTGPAAAAINHTGDAELVETTIAKALQPYRITEEIYFLQNSFLVFIAGK